MSEIRKDKYCLKGEYYKALEIVNYRLSYMVPRSFRKEVYNDLLEIFFRNQNQCKPLNNALGKSLDDFIDELLETYYLTLPKRKLINYLLQNGFLYSLLCIINYIVIANNSEGSILPYSFAAIIMGGVGFLGGITSIYANYKSLYKFSGYKKDLFKSFLTLWPIFFVVFTDKYIFNITKNIYISKNTIFTIIFLELIIYLALVLLFKNRRKRE